MSESVKTSLEKSKNVLEKRKIVKQTICIKDTFTIIAMNCVQEQLISVKLPLIAKRTSKLQPEIKS